MVENDWLTFSPGYLIFWKHTCWLILKVEIACIPGVYSVTTSKENFYLSASLAHSWRYMKLKPACKSLLAILTSIAVKAQLFWLTALKQSVAKASTFNQIKANKYWLLQLFKIRHIEQWKSSSCFLYYNSVFRELCVITSFTAFTTDYLRGESLSDAVS